MPKKKTTEVAVVPTQPKPDTSVNEFISQAISANLPVETMERLFALREKIKSETAKEAFISAMSSFQGECPIIKKTKVVKNKEEKGGGERYRFAPIDSISEQIKPLLVKNGLSYTFDVKNAPGLITAICTVTHILGHSESSEFQVPIDTASAMSAPQKFAAAQTFAKRYAMMNALGISTGDDDNDAVDTDVKAPKNETPEQMYERAMSSIKACKDVDTLIGYDEKIQGSKKYTADQKKKLASAISSKIDVINGAQ